MFMYESVPGFSTGLWLRRRARGSPSVFLPLACMVVGFVKGFSMLRLSLMFSFARFWPQIINYRHLCIA